jgi:hypothetical protein
LRDDPGCGSQDPGDEEGSDVQSGVYCEKCSCSSPKGCGRFVHSKLIFLGKSRESFAKGPMIRSFLRHSQETVKGVRVLVCSIDPQAQELFEADYAVYLSHYRTVESRLVSNVAELLDALSKGYDIVHLFCGLSGGGQLADPDGNTLVGTELIGICCQNDVKLLWMANENKADGYIKGFRAAARRLNLIMTLNRNGPNSRTS